MLEFYEIGVRAISEMNMVKDDSKKLYDVYYENSMEILYHPKYKEFQAFADYTLMLLDAEYERISA